MKTSRVKLLQAMAGPGGVFQAGQIVEVSSLEAEQLVGSHQAVIVEDSEPANEQKAVIPEPTEVAAKVDLPHRALKKWL